MLAAQSSEKRVRGHRATSLLSVILALALSLPVAAIAQAPPPPGTDQPSMQDQQQDPPARVGRLSYLSGTVSFRTLDDDQWEAAVVNYPVTGGLGFWTEPSARATLQLGHGAVRMESSTEVDVQQFDDQVIQIGVPQGSINFRLHSIDPGETYLIVAPTGTVQLDRPGRYNLTVAADGSPARLSVLEGSAEIVGDAGNIIVNAGEVGLVTPTPTSPTPAAARPQPIDSFSDQQEAAMGQVPNYVSPNIPGIQDVAATGDWGSTPDYGQVWYPPVQAGWAPYRYGHWAFVAPWGWTWIDDAPWGFAPFHYGRWVLIGPRWAWVPGAVVPQPVYAPALVAFVGGAALAVNFGVGPVVGWIPLGPREVYVPPYGSSINYIRNVNVTNVTNVTVINNTTINNYRSQGADRYANAGGATVVRSNAMTGSAPIRSSSINVDPSRFRGVNTASGAPVRPNLGTAGVSRNIVEAAGGNASTGSSNRIHAPGPKGGTKVYTPTSASSKTTGAGGFKTFTPPGGVKSFVPAAGAGAGAGAGARTGSQGNGPAGARTYNPRGNGTGTGSATGATGNPKTSGGQGKGSGTGSTSQSTGTGGSKTFAPQGSSGSGSTGTATGNQKTFGGQTGNSGSGSPPKSAGSTNRKTITPQGTGGGTGGASGSTGAATGNPKTYGSQSGSGSGGNPKSMGSNNRKTITPPGSGTGTSGSSGSSGAAGGNGKTYGSQGGNGTSTGSKSTGVGSNRTNSPQGSGNPNGNKSGGTGTGTGKTNTQSGSGGSNSGNSKSGSPPPCNPPQHIVNGKCV